MSGNAEFRELARRLTEMERRLDGVGGPQLASSSLEAGYVNEYDENGVLVSRWGRQADGTHGAVTLNGPNPPVPYGITLTPAPGGAWVRWSGEWEALPDPSDPEVVHTPSVAPLDFAHVEVHASDDPVNFTGFMFETLVSRITGARGGSTFVQMEQDTDYFVRLVARSTSGRSGAPSDMAGPVRAGKIGVTDLGFDLDEIGGNKISYGPTEPVDPQIGNLWYAEVGQDPDTGDFLYESRRYAGEVDGWKPVESQRVHDALATAIAAQIEAENAGLGAIYAGNLAKQKSRWETGTIPPTPTAEESAGIAVLWWVDAGAGNQIKTWNATTNEWDPYRLGNGAIEPKSLIASDVIATGTITAALFEAIMVLASVLIAGDPVGFHARIDEEGVRIYRLSPDGAVVQAGQFGGQTGSGDFISGGRDENGNPLWSIDESGVPSFQGLFVAGDPVIMGRPFTKWVGAASGAGNGQPELSGAENMVAWADGSIGSVTSEVGLIEAVVNVDANRWYKVGCEVNYARGVDTEAVFRVRDGGTAGPSLTSPLIYRRNFSNGQPFYDSTTGWATGVWYPSTSGVHRLGLTAAAQGAGVIDVRTLLCLPTIIVEDMGPRKPISASVNRMGGGVNPPPPPPTPKQQYYVDMAPSGWVSYRGDGSARNDVTGPVQGYTQYAPSNGDGKGHWWFPMPSITGTIDRMDFYVYCDHWHFDSGGVAIINMAFSDQLNSNYRKAKPDWHVGGYPKYGDKVVTLPWDWYPYYTNAGAAGLPRANGIMIGPSGGTDPIYYGRFNGPRARLRIWYTQ